MVRDDSDNPGVKIAFYVLIGINFALFCYTAWKMKTLLALKERNRHILALYASILLYSLRTLHIVRIIWYLDPMVTYPLAAYYALEEAPDLLLFTAYCTISSLWLEIYLSFRSQRPCPIRTLQTCRFTFISLNCCIYLTFVAMQITENAIQGHQYM